MRIIETKAYQFNELEPEAQARAIKKWQDAEAGSGDNFWSEHPLEEAAEQGRLLGFSFKERSRKSISGKPLPSTPCIYWSGFWSQGDGACFVGTWSARDCLAGAGKVAEGWGCQTDKSGTHSPRCPTCELRSIAKALLVEASAFPEASFRVEHSGHYSHEYCTYFSFSFPDDNEGEDWPEDKRDEYQAACDQLQDLSRSFMRWIYWQLESAYEYQLSEENARESILANEYEFTEGGERI